MFPLIVISTVAYIAAFILAPPVAGSLYTEITK